MTAFHLAAIETTGTVTLRAGDTALVGNGTDFNLKAITGGFIVCDGLASWVASVTDDETATLGEGWPGPDKTDRPYFLFRPTSQAALLIEANDRIMAVRQALKELEGRSLLDIDAFSDDIADRAAFDAEDAGFVFMLVPAPGEAGSPTYYKRLTETAGVWSGGFGFEGPRGRAFDHEGFGAPSDSLGADGQSYLDQSNGDTYEKAAGTWGSPSGSIAEAGGLQAANNLSELTDLPTAQINLGVREVLTANRTYHTRIDGSDSNDGLDDSAGGAFRTVQKLVDVAKSIDHSIYQVTGSIGAGAFPENISIKNTLGSFNFVLQGAGVSTVIGAGSGVGIDVAQAGSVTIRDIAIADNQLISLRARFSNFVSLLGTIQLGSATARQVEVRSAYVESTSMTMMLDGAAPIWLIVFPGGAVNFTSGVTVGTTGALTYSNDFIEVQQGNASFGGSITWDETAGAITGRQCEVKHNGILNLNGAALSTIPGDTTGITASGGQVV